MILVTGGTGLLGAQLVFDLVRQQQRVKVMVRSTSDMRLLQNKFKENPALYKTIEFTQGDILDSFSIQDALAGVKEVYHCAAIISFDKKLAAQMMKVNIEGTENLVNACLALKVEKFCHVSSVATLGRNSTETLLNENILWNHKLNNSNYAISKYGAEREVWRAINEGLPAVIVNPSIILGPGNWRSDSSSLIKGVHDGLRYYTNGVSGFVDVRDVSSLMIELMQQAVLGERFIISGHTCSYHNLLCKIAHYLGVKPPSVLATPFLSGLAWRLEKMRALISGRPTIITKETVYSAQQKYYYDTTKIKTKTNFTFIDLDETLQWVCSQYKEELAS
jgi:nucleoside-diphosphate-sugar epimerase